jgi:hypothetical protein
MTNNPFKDCVVRKNNKEQWCVDTIFWRIPCLNEKDAQRLCNIIQSAYRAGASDLREQFNALLVDNYD